MKREAARYSITRPYQNQILNCKDLYQWARTNLNGIKIKFVQSIIIKKTARKLNSRFLKAKLLTGTKKYHCFIPVPESKHEIIVKQITFSQQQEFKSIS